MLVGQHRRRLLRLPWLMTVLCPLSTIVLPTVATALVLATRIPIVLPVTIATASVPIPIVTIVLRTVVLRHPERVEEEKISCLESERAKEHNAGARIKVFPPFTGRRLQEQ